MKMIYLTKGEYFINKNSNYKTRGSVLTHQSVVSYLTISYGYLKIFWQSYFASLLVQFQ